MAKQTSSEKWPPEHVSHHHPPHEMSTSSSRLPLHARKKASRLQRFWAVVKLISLIRLSFVRRSCEMRNEGCLHKWDFSWNARTPYICSISGALEPR